MESFTEYTTPLDQSAFSWSFYTCLNFNTLANLYHFPNYCKIRGPCPVVFLLQGTSVGWGNSHSPKWYHSPLEWPSLNFIGTQDSLCWRFLISCYVTCLIRYPGFKPSLSFSKGAKTLFIYFMVVVKYIFRFTSLLRSTIAIKLFNMPKISLNIFVNHL